MKFAKWRGLGAKTFKLSWVDADALCAGENVPDSRWPQCHFLRPSHLLALAPETRNQSNGIDR